MIVFFVQNTAKNGYWCNHIMADNEMRSIVTFILGAIAHQTCQCTVMLLIWSDMNNIIVSSTCIRNKAREEGTGSPIVSVK